MGFNIDDNEIIVKRINRVYHFYENLNSAYSRRSSGWDQFFGGFYRGKGRIDSAFQRDFYKQLDGKISPIISELKEILKLTLSDEMNDKIVEFKELVEEIPNENLDYFFDDIKMEFKEDLEKIDQFFTDIEEIRVKAEAIAPPASAPQQNLAPVTPTIPKPPVSNVTPPQTPAPAPAQNNSTSNDLNTGVKSTVKNNIVMTWIKNHIIIIIIGLLLVFIVVKKNDMSLTKIAINWGGMSAEFEKNDSSETSESQVSNEITNNNNINTSKDLDTGVKSTVKNK